jgi:hypothetical protein
MEFNEAEENLEIVSGNEHADMRTIAGGSVVVKALCYKPEGCGFET